MSKILNVRFQNKHDCEYNWNQAGNFIPLAGEIIIYEPDINLSGNQKGTHTEYRIKIGDGVSNVTALKFLPIGENAPTSRVYVVKTAEPAINERHLLWINPNAGLYYYENGWKSVPVNWH